MDDVVDELWSNTVANTPIIKPATGLLSTLFEENTRPMKRKNEVEMDIRDAKIVQLFLAGVEEKRLLYNRQLLQPWGIYKRVLAKLCWNSSFFET